MNVIKFVKWNKFTNDETMATNRTNNKEPGEQSETSYRIQNGLCGPLSWSYLPLIAGIIPMIGLAATYYMAKSKCHVEKWILPYVSYTGARFPELMVFGFLLNLEGFFGIIVVFLAWRYYSHLGEKNSKLNNISLVVGSLSCFGVVVVGNFPVTYSKLPHYCGAGFAFIFGTFYTALTAALSIRTSRRSKLRKIHSVKVARIVLAVVMMMAMSALLVFAIIKKTSVKPSEVLDEAPLLSRNANGSCPYYPNSSRNFDLLGSIVEWILTFGILICISLYSYEFKSFDSIKISLKKNGNFLTPGMEIPLTKSCSGGVMIINKEDDEEDDVEEFVINMTTNEIMMKDLSSTAAIKEEC